MNLYSAHAHIDTQCPDMKHPLWSPSQREPFENSVTQKGM